MVERGGGGFEIDNDAIGFLVKKNLLPFTFKTYVEQK